MEDFKITRYFNTCSPYKTSSLDSKEYVDIDNFMIDDRKVDVRGGGCIDTIAKIINRSEEASISYFTGYPGSGKTTELEKLQRKLETDWLCVKIDTMDYLDLNATISTIDIYTTIIYSLANAVGRYTNLSEDQIFKSSGYLDRLVTWLKDTHVELKSGELGIDGGKLIIEMKNIPAFREQVRAHLESHFTKFRDDTMREIEQLNKTVQSFERDGRRKKGLVVIVDSLEKNHGIGDTIDPVAKAIEGIFVNRERMRLPIHVVYTISPYLSARGNLGKIEFLPVVKVIDKNDIPYRDGIEVMRMIAHRRIDENDLQIMLGDTHKDRLKQLILLSGGFPRDFLILLQQVVLVEDYPLSENAFIKIFSNIKNQYQEFLPIEYKETLQQIQIDKSINSIQSDDKHRIAYDLFRNHVILRYQNNDIWFSVHPAALSFLQDK